MSTDHKEHEYHTHEYAGRSIEHLKSIATSTEERSVFVDLTDEELDIQRRRLQDAALKLKALELEKKQMIENFKEKMKPHQEDYGQALGLLKTGTKEEVKTVYIVPNHDERQIEYYTEDGEQVDRRPMSSEEYHRPLPMKFNT